MVTDRTSLIEVWIESELLLVVETCPVAIPWGIGVDSDLLVCMVL